MTERHDKAAATRRVRTRRQIISRSRPLLDKRSPHDLTHQEVAKHVGSTRATVMEYFPDLSALTVNVYMRSIYETHQQIRRVETQDARTQLTATIIELTTLFVKHPSLAAAFLAIAEEPEEAQHPTYIAVVSYLKGKVDIHLDGIQHKKEIARQPGVYYLRTIIEWTYLNFARHDTPEPEKIEAFAHRTVTNLGR